jgi:hypothetical protein
MCSSLPKDTENCQLIAPLQLIARLQLIAPLQLIARLQLIASLQLSKIQFRKHTKKT